MPETQAEREAMKTAEDEAHEIAKEIPNPSESGVSTREILTPHIERLYAAARAEPLEVLRKVRHELPRLPAPNGDALIYRSQLIARVDALLAGAPEVERRPTHGEFVDLLRWVFQAADEPLQSAMATRCRRMPGACWCICHTGTIAMTAPEPAEPTAEQVAEAVRDYLAMVACNAASEYSSSIARDISQRVRAAPLKPALKLLAEPGAADAK
jgi:hypothetical protein